MSTSEGRPLTRRQLRELRETGQNPIITEQQIAQAREDAGAPAAEPVVDPGTTPSEDGVEASRDDADSRLAAESDRTSEPRQEAFSENVAPPVADDSRAGSEEPTEARTAAGTSADEPTNADPEPESARPRLTRRQLREQERRATGAVDVTADAGVTDDSAARTRADDAQQAAPGPAAPARNESRDAPAPAPTAPEKAEPAATVRDSFGRYLVDGQPVSKPTFDELLTQPHETSGSSSAPSTLVLNDIPAAAALNAPITSTSELLVTSSHKLPEGFGSSGAAKGTTDGREVDAVLLDGEIPLASSPTPIAASNAVSTSKSPGEVIRPPAPEKNHKLVLTLGITAGGLCIVVIAAVVTAYVTGVFG